jgi:hypothetical protein
VVDNTNICCRHSSLQTRDVGRVVRPVECGIRADGGRDMDPRRDAPLVAQMEGI